jgi:hypothetical protein
MPTLYAIITLITFAAAAFLLTRLLRVPSRVAGGLACVTLFAAVVVEASFVLSALHRLADLGAWAGAGVVVLLLAAAPCLTPAGRAVCLARPAGLADIEARLRAVDRHSWLARLLLLVGIAVGLVTLIAFVEVMTLEPATPDAHQYHLARLGYYLQQGSFAYFDASYWAQVVYPRVATALHLFAYLTSGAQIVLTQLVQFVAFLVCSAALYGIGRGLGQRRQQAALVAGLFGLLIICFTEASTAQNDLILSAFVGCALYFFLAYRTWRSPVPLALAAVALALAAGVKATFVVVLLPLAVVAGFALRGADRRHLWLGAAALLLAGACLVLPAGYADNLARFGDPFGPKAVRGAYTAEGTAPGAMLAHAGLNVLRYGVDFLRLDGWYPVPGADRVQAGLIALPRALLSAVGIDLECPDGAAAHFPFRYTRPIRADESTSSWGMLGFLLIWPAVLAAVWRRGAGRVFAAATLLYALILCVIVPYDPFHGRFFITGALFALPTVAAWLPPRGAAGRAWVAGVVALGCVNALIGASFRTGTALVDHRDYAGRAVPSVFRLGSSGMLTREAPWALLLFEARVPKDAVVAIDLQHHAPEFLFFGEGFTRRLVPLRPFVGPRKPLPAEATWLVYDASSPFYSAKGIALTDPSFPLGVIFLKSLSGSRR